jgi:nucleoid-associated protein YgaU
VAAAPESSPAPQAPAPGSTPAETAASTAPAAGPAASPPAEPGANPVVADMKTVEVRRGDNLWRISRRVYGEGIRYSTIYEANTSQIRDPDRIYPGQIFVMPGG